MQLHIFNPSHDEALAANYPFYYPSVMARTLAARWAEMPALWAQRGDVVWVNGGGNFSLTEGEAAWCGGVFFASGQELPPRLWAKVTSVEPWGWDLLLRHRLRKAGAPSRLLPNDSYLENVRRLSSRHTTAQLLPRIRQRLENAGVPTVGKSVIIETEAAFDQLISRWGATMCKSLWSCSGRGVFRITGGTTASDRGRIRRLLREQGGVEVEPAYEPVAQFALEFSARPAGDVAFEGLSFFTTGTSGAYVANVVAEQGAIRDKLTTIFPCERWIENAVAICQDELRDFLHASYCGPLGVDMMLCRTAAGVALLPCVEVNLRRTMGHAALALRRRGLAANLLPDNLRAAWAFA